MYFMVSRKFNYILYCFLFAISIAFYQAQTPALITKKRIDSLQTVLTKTTVDSVKLKINILLGELAPIKKIAYWDNLKKQAQALNYSLYEAKVLQNMSDTYYDAMNIKAADSVLTIALKITETINNKRESLSIIKKLIKVNFDNLNRKYFLDLHYKGIELAENLNDKKEIIDFEAKLGTYYFFVNEYKKAITIHLKCLSNSKLINYKNGIITALSDIGANYANIGDTMQAIKYYLQCKKYLIDVKGTADEAYIYNVIGTAYIISYKNDSAKKYILLSYNCYERNNNIRGMASSLIELSSLYYNEKQYVLAEQYALKSLELAQSTQFIGQIIPTTFHLKKIYLNKGDYKKALEMNELYHLYSDSLANNTIKKQASEKEFSYNIEKKENQNKLLAQQNQLQTLRLNQNNYFILILIILIVAIIIVTYLVVKQNRLKALQQSLFLEQKLLRVQMNPHFISNCLAAIQELIYANDYKKASLYLAKFSFFLRQILNHSEKSYVTLAQEIEIIKLNIELEQLRFNDAFAFELNIDEDIEADELYIPTLLTQPIIENAIWHGLLPLKGLRNPKLSIDIYKKEKLYYIDIIDNGVGRVNHTTPNGSGRVSKGTSLVLDKISNVNKLMNDSSYKLHIEDLKDTNHLPIGTKVTIQLTDLEPLL